MIAAPRPLLYLVTDRHRLPTAGTLGDDSLRALDEQLDAAIHAGIDVIQVRERDLPAVQLRALVADIVRRAAGTSTRVIVNDRADIAAATGADGVHLRSDGPAAARVRTAHSVKLVGRSVHATADVVANGDADYLLFGHVFSSVSKKGLPPAGLTTLADVVAAARCPVIGIGGIDATNARACLDAGAAGVAAIGAFVPPAGVPARAHLAGAIAAFREALQNC